MPSHPFPRGADGFFIAVDFNRIGDTRETIKKRSYIYVEHGKRLDENV
jgi:hypothetical protein